MASALQAAGSVGDALAHAERLAVARPDLALLQIDAILRAAPGMPQALLLKGRTERASGQIGVACTTLTELAAAQPNSAATAYELGLANYAAGDAKAAIAELRRAVTLKPNLAEAWTTLAEVLRLSGENAQADHASLSGVRASTRDPVLARAAIALLDGRLADAEAILRGRLRGRPADVAAIRMMAELAVRLARYGDAIKLLIRAVELSPGFAAAREMLARTLQRHDRPAEALSEVDRLLAADPANPSYAMLRAALLVRVGEQDEAAKVYGDVLGRFPQQAKAWMRYGHVLQTIGRSDEAIDAYREALRQDRALSDAWWSLANLKTFRFSPDDVAEMRAALDRAAEDRQRVHLHFALGKALEDEGEDAAAFAAYAQGNAIHHATLGYDPDDTADQCRREATLFSPAFLAARVDGGCTAPDPIFIVGLPRSGSTLIEQILASHSLVEGTDELPDLMAIAARLAGRRAEDQPVAYPKMLADLSADARRALGEEYIERTRVHRREKTPFFIDKMPNNWMHVGLIRLILPNAKVIDARRHPLGTGWSAFKQHFALGQGFTYDQTDLGRYYRDYAVSMAHADRVMPGFVHRVIYEHMVADTETQVRALLARCGLPFEQACLDFHQTARAVRTPSAGQVRQPIFADAVGHWRRFEPWLGGLKAALGDVLTVYPAVPDGIAFSNDGTKPLR